MPTSPESSGPSGRPRLGPYGLLSRRRTGPDPDGPPARPVPPRGRVPEPPASPLPSALLPLPPGFELNRDPVGSVAPAQARHPLADPAPARPGAGALAPPRRTGTVRLPRFEP